MQNMLGYFYPVIFMIILVFLAYGPTLYLNYLDDKNERVLNFPSSKLKVSFRDRLSSLRRSCHHWSNLLWENNKIIIFYTILKYLKFYQDCKINFVLNKISFYIFYL